MKTEKTGYSFFCVILALLLLCPAFSGCADASGTVDGTPQPAASGSAAALTEDGSEEEKTDPATEPEQTGEQEPYDTYEAFMKFINGLTDQDKIDLVQRTADSITVVKNRWESTHPRVEENPDAYEKITALGPDIFPYLIRYAYYADPKSGAAEDKYVLMLECAIGGEKVPEFPQPFGNLTWYCPEYWPVRYYLWYMEGQKK